MMAGKILPSAVDTEVDHFGGEFRQLMQLPLGRSKFEAERLQPNQGREVPTWYWYVR